MTQKKVPPKTIASEGTSIKGPTPPPETIAYIINPRAPINPRREAISIVFPLCSLFFYLQKTIFAIIIPKMKLIKTAEILASNLFNNIIMLQTNTRELKR